MTHGKHVSGGGFEKSKCYGQGRIPRSLLGYYSRSAKHTASTRRVMTPFLADIERPLLPVCCHKRAVFSQDGWNFLYCIYCNKKWEEEDV